MSDLHARGGSPRGVRPSPAGRAPGRVADRTLAGRFDPRRNNVNALRLLLAALVVVSHSALMSVGSDPIGTLSGGPVDLGTMAVDGFFVLSGFLITRSFQTSPSVTRYLWRRSLRILPGHWVCLLVTVLLILPLAQWMQYGTLAGLPWTGERSMVGYLVANAGLYVAQFEVRGLLGGPVNGSLYTLFYEFLCYLGIAVLGAFGLLTARRRAVSIAIAGLLVAVAVLELATGGMLTADHPARGILLRFGTMFVFGMVARLYAEKIVLSPVRAAVASTGLVIALAAAGFAPPGAATVAAYLVLAPAALGYLILHLASGRWMARIGSRRDLSYGLYVYAWPVQMLGLLAGAATWSLPLFVAVSLATSLGLAYLSWTLVEEPALRLKSWTPRTIPRRSTAWRFAAPPSPERH